VTVQVLAPPELKLVGLHAKEARASGGSSVTEAVCELLPKVAVTTAVCVLLIVLAVAVKVVLVAPLATVTDEGTVRLAALSLTVTAVLAGAA